MFTRAIFRTTHKLHSLLGEIIPWLDIPTIHFTGKLGLGSEEKYGTYQEEV